MGPRAVAFDIDDVLVAWRPERLYRRLIADEAERGRFLGETCPPGWTERFGPELTTAEAAERHAALHPERADAILAWWSCWPEMFGPGIDGSLALLRALKRKGTPVFALANLAADAFDLAQRLYPILAEFDLALVSGREGRRKPEPEIYAALEARSGLPPQALLLVDDEAPNVAAARARGWRAHHFRGPTGLTRALIDAGLLEPHETLGVAPA